MPFQSSPRSSPGRPPRRRSITNGRSGAKSLVSFRHTLMGTYFLVATLSFLYLHSKVIVVKSLISEDQNYYVPYSSVSMSKQSLKSSIRLPIVSGQHEFFFAERNPKKCRTCGTRLKAHLEDPRTSAPNYGGLEISFQGKNKRIVAAKVYSVYERERTEALSDSSFATIKEKYGYHEDLLGERDCYQSGWRAYPVCNNLHEISTERRPQSLHEEYDISFLGHGGFRDAWIYQAKKAQSSDSFVLKRFRIKKEAELKYFSQVQKEAIIMERLTASPHILDIYAFCGTTVSVEAMESTSTPHIIGHKRHMRQNQLGRVQDRANDVVPMNNLTLVQKLDWATTMAESIADLHGYKGGVIVHGDISPNQWLLSSNGSLKLNDFNQAEILNYNPGTAEYCKSYRACFDRKFISPEELRCVHGNEAMDTYSMGHNIYGLLTGLSAFYEYPNVQHDVQKKFKREKNELRPFVDARYRSRSMIEGRLVETMELCWEWDFEKRISIFDVVKRLRQVKKDYELEIA